MSRGCFVFIMLKTIFDNKDFFIVNKPNGLPTIKGKSSPSLEEFILKEYPDQKETTERGIVHRLDNDVSGLVIITKTNDAYKQFRKMFSENEVEKEYTLLVDGLIKDKGIIDALISQNKSSKKKVSISNTGQKAITSFSCLDHFLWVINNVFLQCSLVKAISNSGKRHQIRVHFQHINHPIIGDKLYNKKHCDLTNRIFFHASGLKFTWKHEEYHVQSQLPSDLQSIIDNLIHQE